MSAIEPPMPAGRRPGLGDSERGQRFRSRVHRARGRLPRRAARSHIGAGRQAPCARPRRADAALMGIDQFQPSLRPSQRTARGVLQRPTDRPLPIGGLFCARVRRAILAPHPRPQPRPRAAHLEACQARKRPAAQSALMPLAVQPDQPAWGETKWSTVAAGPACSRSSRRRSRAASDSWRWSSLSCLSSTGEGAPSSSSSAC